MDVGDWLKTGVAAAVGAVLAAVVQAWRKPSSQAELIAAIQKAAHDQIQDLREEVERLQTRVEDVEKANAGLKAANAACQGENRQLWQELESLEAFLRRSGIDVPARDLPRSFIVFEADRVTVLTPDMPQDGGGNDGDKP
jgi:hypothetical protein